MPPKVSVLMITYNQEQYIAQALDSVLMQECNFPFEIVIGEDYSTDNTRAICQEYQQKYPEIIRLLTPGNNLGMMRNFFSTFTECKGEYLTILEGDDFWTDPLKLQKQADFLDSNPDFSIVFARTEVFYQDDDRPGYEIPPLDIWPYTLENLLKINFIATCSVMYRQGLVTEFPAWLYRLEMLDWPLNVLHAQLGKVGFLDEKMAKYRIHAKSTYSSRKVLQNYLGMLKFYRTINVHLNFNYSISIYRFQVNVCREIARLSKIEGHWLNVIQYSALALIYYVLARLAW